MVRPSAWDVELAPWVDLRQKQGWRVEVCEPPDEADELHQLLVRRAAAGTQFAILVGDASPGVDDAYCPTMRAPVSASLRFGGRPIAASDAALADGDGDGVPDLVVARWPFANRESIGRYVERVLAREATTPSGDWRGRIAVAAVPGGFGPLLDSVIENSARELLETCIPASRQLDVMFARPNGTACPDLNRIPEHVQGQFDRGCQFWLYVGHGAPDQLAPLHLRQGRFPVFERRHAAALPPGAERSIAVMLTCLAGDHAGKQECLAESMLAAPHGPVGVLAGSEVTMPYGMATFGYELTRSALEGDAATLGEAVYQAQCDLVADRDDAMRRSLDAIYSAAGSSAVARSIERRDHALLFHLFGDPLIAVERPTTLEISSPAEVMAGNVIPLQCQCEFPGEARFELCLTRARFSQWKPAAEPDGASTMERRDRDVVSVVTTAAPLGAVMEVALPVPEDASGEYLLRGLVLGGKQFAAGVAKIRVASP